MKLTKIVINNIIKGMGMSICPYPDYEQLSLNKQRRHNQIKRWITNKPKIFDSEKREDLRYNYYKPHPTETIAIMNGWLRIGNALRKAYESEIKLMKNK